MCTLYSSDSSQLPYCEIQRVLCNILVLVKIFSPRFCLAIASSMPTGTRPYTSSPRNGLRPVSAYVSLDDWDWQFAFGLTNWQEKWPSEPSLRKVFWALEVSKATADSRAALREIVARL